VAILEGVGIGLGVAVGVTVGLGLAVGVGVGVATRLEIAPHPTIPGKSDKESNKMPALKNTFLCFILVSFLDLPPNGWFQRQRRDGQDSIAQNQLRWLAPRTHKRRSRCPLQTVLAAV